MKFIVLEKRKIKSESLLKGILILFVSFIERRKISMHEYYEYGREQLEENPQIPIEILKDNESVFRAMAQEMVEEIEKNNGIDKKTVFICPVGPVGHYPYFVERVNKKRVNLKNVWFINMDEYLTDEKQWISEDSKLSFRGFMNKNVYSKIDKDLVMPLNQRIFPNPNNLNEIPELIKELGGVDICFGGIGINGHVAFNEADSNMENNVFLTQPTRILKITEATRAINSVSDLNGAYEDMPKYCITIGMNEIYNSKKIRLGCFRDWHRSVVRRAAYGEKTASFPVTLLRDHKDITLRVTEFVADLP